VREEDHFPRRRALLQPRSDRRCRPSLRLTVQSVSANNDQEGRQMTGPLQVIAVKAYAHHLRLAVGNQFP